MLFRCVLRLLGGAIQYEHMLVSQQRHITRTVDALANKGVRLVLSTEALPDAFAEVRTHGCGCLLLARSHV